MEGSLWGIALTIAAPFGVLGLATGVRKCGASAETSRKLVHILLSNWILLALAVYKNALACIIPACFVVINYLSYKKVFFSAIEREVDNTLGTVWYAVSLFLLCLAGYSCGMPWIAACGMLAMGYGDGLGGLIGRRFGKSYFPGSHSKKSFEGSLVVMVFSGLAVGFVCAVYAPDIFPYFPLYAALLCAVPAAAIELFSPCGVDNLTLPLGVSLLVFLLVRYPDWWQFFACLSAALVVLIIAYYLSAITFRGLVVAELLGVLLFCFGGWLSFGALVLFFVLGSAVSKFGKQKKASATKLHEKKGARSISQVIANGLPPLIFAISHYFTGNDACLLAVLASLAAATSDTFSSEIGMLSSKDPVSILTLKKVPPGMSGGVTMLGFAGGLLGAFLISVLAVPKFGIAGMLVVIAAGIIDSILDSVLGDAFQAKYQMTEEKGKSVKGLTEQKCVDGKVLKLVKGISWVNNDIVNFVSAFISGLFVALL